ncbi:phage major capsid protein [Mastigocladus laminosus UU774]|nr:phage major capsid protein [Mastigocladus laminosus UU774]
MAVQNYPNPLTPASALVYVISQRLALAKDVTYPTLSYLTQKRTATQKQIKWNADVGGEATTVKDVTEDVQTNTQGKTEGASLAIGETAFTHSFDLVKTDITEALNIGIDAISNLYQSYVDRAVVALMRKLNRSLYLGDGTKAHARVLGMEYVTTNTNNYAGINRTTYPKWRSLTFSNAGDARALTTALMRRVETVLLENERTYDAILTTPEVVEQYKEVFDESRVFNVASGNNQGVDLGIGTVTYAGRPIIADPACPVGTMYFVDSRDLFIHSYQTPGDALLEGIRIQVGELPTQNIYAQKWELGILPQLQVWNPLSIAKLTDIATYSNPVTP